MKVTIEWPGQEPKTWRQIKVDEHHSQRDNCFVKHDGKVYVYKSRRVGTPVLSQVDGKWTEVGRIDISCHIFLGGKDELSYSEYSRTPEALEQAEKWMENWRNERFKTQNKNPVPKYQFPTEV